MCSHKTHVFALALLGLSTGVDAQTYQIGHKVTDAQVAPWSIDVFRTARACRWKGSVSEGKPVYEAKCAACHGATGEGGLADRLVGGTVRLSRASPSRPSVATGLMPVRPTITSIGRCHTTARSHSRRTRFTPSLRTCSI